MNEYTFRSLLDNHNIPASQKAFGYIGREYLSYGDVKLEINNVKTYLVQAGIGKGDKVALLSENQPNWGIVYLAVTSFGAVIVPILPDFGSKQIANILDHSEAKMIFLSAKQKLKIDEIALNFPVYSLETLSLIKGSIDESISYTEDIYDIAEEDVAAILYTSGTTGNSKGV
ncbi:MAG: AMP-binding protein, partial [Spirochaetaceae bacterium]|nr:AMP-binding protein [Spirochaetaceae bacterium]